jgi:phage-related baseplate assembly protein
MSTALPAATEHEYQRAERTLIRRIVVAMAVAAPIGALVFAVMTGATASIAGVSVAGPAAAGAVIGVLAGVFWGMWIAVCASVAEFERLEGHPHKKKRA